MPDAEPQSQDAGEPRLHDNLLAPEIVADPYAYYGALRERDPVHYNSLLGAWVVTGYEDVRACFRDPRLSSDRITPYYKSKLSGPDADKHRTNYEMMSRWMVFVDAPDHTRLRKLIDRAFRPKAVARMNEHIEQLVKELLDGLSARGEMDFVHDFAFPLPVLVICELFGVPPEDRDQVKAWSEDILTLVFGALDVPDRHDRTRKAFEAMSDYLRALIAERRKAPGTDLLSTLLQKEADGEELSEQEIIATCVLALFGGHETTTNLLANGLKALLENPEQWEKLKADPALLPSAVEELLRFDGPSKAMWRVVTEPMQLGKRKLHTGDRVLLVQSSANRDPERFENPDALDIERKDNLHMGFGYGAHYCIGAPFARLEGIIALRELIKRMPDIQLATDQFEWQPTLLNRALKSLPVRFTAFLS